MNIIKENISPEEKLLRLVKHGAKKAPVSSASALPPKTKKPVFVPGVKKFFRPRYLNYLLVFFLFLSLLNLTLNLTLLRPAGKIGTLPLLLPLEKISADKDLVPKIKPYSYYAQQIGKRELFLPSTGKIRKAASLSLREMMRDFTLVGITKRNDPQAIIRDKKAKKTYFLKRGDYLGEIRIGDIKQGKVILEYQGENFVLFL